METQRLFGIASPLFPFPLRLSVSSYIYIYTFFIFIFPPGLWLPPPTVHRKRTPDDTSTAANLRTFRTEWETESDILDDARLYEDS